MILTVDEALKTLEAVLRESGTVLDDDEIADLENLIRFFRGARQSDILAFNNREDKYSNFQFATRHRLADLRSSSYHVIGELGRNPVVEDLELFAEDLNRAGYALISEIDNNDENPYYMIAEVEEVD